MEINFLFLSIAYFCPPLQFFNWQAPNIPWYIFHKKKKKMEKIKSEHLVLTLKYCEITLIWNSTDITWFSHIIPKRSLHDFCLYDFAISFCSGQFYPSVRNNIPMSFLMWFTTGPFAKEFIKYGSMHKVLFSFLFLK